MTQRTRRRWRRLKVLEIFAFKMMNSAFKMMNFALKMMDFPRRPTGESCKEEEKGILNDEYCINIDEFGITNG